MCVCIYIYIYIYIYNIYIYINYIYAYLYSSYLDCCIQVLYKKNDLVTKDCHIQLPSHHHNRFVTYHHL